MPTDGERLLQGYGKLDALMVRAGAPATSLPWLEHLAGFWRSGKRRMVVRKGRQVGASTIILPRVAVATALFGAHRRTQGTHLAIPIVSVSTKDAKERLFNLCHVLGVIGEPYTRRDDTIELRDHPIVFSVAACSARTAVGMTSLAIFQEEVARWWSDETNANPGPEVDAALTPSLVTQPNGRIYSFSSPVGPMDFHAELMGRGDTPEQYTCSGSSWYWNPTLTEAETHALQPDERRWRREFAAIPQVGAMSAFDHDDVERCFTPLEYKIVDVSKRVYCLDSAGGGDCEFAGGCAVWVQKPWSTADSYVFKEHRYPAGHLWEGRVSGRSPLRDAAGNFVMSEAEPLPPVLTLYGVWGLRVRQTTSEKIKDFIATECRRYGAKVATGDQYSAWENLGALGARGVRFEKRQWTSATKQAAAGLLRTLMRDRRLLLMPDGTPEDRRILRDQLLNYTERAGSGGLFSYGARTGLSDRCSVVMAAAMASLSTETQPSLFGLGDPNQKPGGGPARETGYGDYARGNS